MAAGNVIAVTDGRTAAADGSGTWFSSVMSQADIERMLIDKPKVAIRMLETVGRRLTNAEARLEPAHPPARPGRTGRCPG